ncbi:Ribosomal protein L24e, putative [Leishmania shawi]|uniref:Ribosomal protein L24e n=1 Tax=Leishmania shawi TaxID=5680 RepID=A0ABR3EG26_9TRYP
MGHHCLLSPSLFPALLFVSRSRHAYDRVRVLPLRGAPRPRPPVRALRVPVHEAGADLLAPKKNPRFIPWTRTYRRIHRKTTTDRVNRRRAARAVRVQRAIVGADLSYIQEVRATRKEDRSAKAKAVRAEVAERKAAKK